jgi:hypothetical protein
MRESDVDRTAKVLRRALQDTGGMKSLHVVS